MDVNEEGREMDISIQERTLPGVGRRYDLALDHCRQLSVIVSYSGQRRLSIGHEAADEPTATAVLSHTQAIAVAALLSGVHLTVRPAPEAPAAPEDLGEDDVVTVTTVTLSDTSPVIGRKVSEIELPAGSHAAVIAVIRDHTPELVEDLTRVPCTPGDRLVVVARTSWSDHVTAMLAGA